MKFNKKTIGIIGLTSVVVWIVSLIVFGLSNPNFSFLNDYVSLLGAKGEPNALWFNLIGFVLVGLLLVVFGFSFGFLLKDKLLAILLSLFGLGFVLTAIPMDMEFNRTPVSKAHIVSICLGLAAWLFGLARMGANKSLPKKVQVGANIAATLLTLSMIGFAIELWSMPITHRLVFTVVFGWTAFTSIDLIVNLNLNQPN